MTAEEELTALARLGRRMRQLQRHYFKSRSNDALAASKRAEAEFDKACEAVLDYRTGDLFAQTPEEGAPP